MNADEARKISANAPKPHIAKALKQIEAAALEGNLSVDIELIWGALSAAERVDLRLRGFTVCGSHVSWGPL